MTERTDQRDAIATALAAFAARPLAEAARGLFAALGYASDRRVPLATPKAFIGQFDAAGRLTAFARFKFSLPATPPDHANSTLSCLPKTAAAFSNVSSVTEGLSGSSSRSNADRLVFI